MATNWKQIKEEYLLSYGKINLKELAEKYNINYSTLRKRKIRKKWDSEIVTKEEGNVLIIDQHTEEEGKKVTKANVTKPYIPLENVPNVTENVTEDNSIVTSQNSNIEEDSTTETTEEETTENQALTGKQVKFCKEYIIDFNATRASISAGYSTKTARQIGYENLTKPYIQAEIKLQCDKLIHKLEISITRIVMEYAKIAFSDITFFMDIGRKKKSWVDKKGKKQSATIDYAQLKKGMVLDGSLIQEIKSTDWGLSVKLYDKMKALEALAKISGLFNDEHKKMIEIEKLRVIQEKLKLEQSRNDKNTDNGNLDEMIASLDNIDISRYVPLHPEEFEEEGES